MTNGKRRAAIAAMLMLAVTAAVILFVCAGRVLIVSDPIVRADAIVVLAGQRIERTYEAAKLYRDGVAPRIYLSHPLGEEDEHLARAFRIRTPSFHDSQRQVLEQLGVPTASVIDLSGQQTSTADEAALTASLAAIHKFKQVTVVTSPYHSRRARMYFRAAADGRFEVHVRPSRYEQVDPRRWWQKPRDRVDVVLEWMKFVKAIPHLVRRALL